MHFHESYVTGPLGSFFKAPTMQADAHAGRLQWHALHFHRELLFRRDRIGKLIDDGEGVTIGATVRAENRFVLER